MKPCLFVCAGIRLEPRPPQTEALFTSYFLFIFIMQRLIISDVLLRAGKCPPAHVVCRGEYSSEEDKKIKSFLAHLHIWQKYGFWRQLLGKS